MAYSSVSPLTVFGSMVASICPSANNSNTVWSRIFVRGRRPKDPRITRQGSARNGKHCSRHPWMILPSTRVGEAEPMCWKTGPTQQWDSTACIQCARTNTSRPPECKAIDTNERRNRRTQHPIEPPFVRSSHELMEYSERRTST